MARMRWQAGGLFAIGMLGLLALWLQASRAVDPLDASGATWSPDTNSLLSRGGDICRAVAPEADGLTLSVQQSHDTDAVPTRGVVGTDPDGHDVVSASWSARTGELFVVCHYARVPGIDRLPALTRDEAMRAAWNWMETLGVAGREQGWRLARPGVHPNRTWGFRWLTQGRSAFVTVDDRTGSLVMLVCRPADPRAWAPAGDA